MKRQTLISLLLFLHLSGVIADTNAVDPLSLSFSDPFPLIPIIDRVSDTGVDPSTKFIALVGGKLSKFFTTFEVTVLNKNKIAYLIDARSICPEFNECKKIEEQIVTLLKTKYPTSQAADMPGNYHIPETDIYFRVTSSIQSLSPYRTVHLQIFNRKISDSTIRELEKRLEKAWSR